MAVSAKELDAKIEQLSTDIDLARSFVQGDEQTIVPLGDSEPVPTPSIRKLVGDFKNVADGQLALSQAAADRAEEAAKIAVSNLGNLKSLAIAVDDAPYGHMASGSYNADTGMLTLRVPEGRQGEQGLVGDTGPQGPQGIQGDQGDTGNAGPQGVQGLQGVQGKPGPQGIQGPVGTQGPEGEIGAQGPQGVKGDKGDTGDVGPQGPVGEVGPQGPRGPKGNKGDTGATGPQGVQGPAGPQGPVGEPGAMGASPLPMAFGQFRVDAEGMLTLEYSGSVDPGGFTINENGELEVSYADN